MIISVLDVDENGVQTLTEQEVDEGYLNFEVKHAVSE